jgi:hypothetical protein
MTPLRKVIQPRRHRVHRGKTKVRLKAVQQQTPKSTDSLRDTSKPPCPLCLCGKSGSFFGGTAPSPRRQNPG